MDFFPPFRNNSEKRNCFIYILASIIIFFLFDYCYQLNLFCLRDVEYYKQHTIPAFLYSISNIPFLIVVMYVLCRYARGVAEWFKYLGSFTIDVCTVYTIFAFRDPSLENFCMNALVLISIGVFVLKLILFFFWDRFKRIKMI